MGEIAVEPDFDHCVFIDAYHVEVDVKNPCPFIDFPEPHEACIQQIESFLNRDVYDFAGPDGYSFQKDGGFVEISADVAIEPF